MTDETEADPELMEQGRKLFLRPCVFVAGAMTASQLPGATLPEIAFAGRSNVGKSSLINALTNQKALAKTSQTPGRTRQLNFFDCDGVVQLVDLPGYGYAKAPKSDVKAWTKLTLGFLKGRTTLKRVMLLIDSRRGIGDKDREIMTLFDQSAVAWAVVLTKIDKLSQAEQQKVITNVQAEAARHVAAWPGVFVTSAEKRIGLDEIRAHIITLT
ncbi:MAG: ribosome biogenesis GTP-binding protein YihA/YsxC [Proteobacteria bacterium]|jgi:GTP-binding protein|nr:ribosome biogenesis GTP-binding protein YihA/YsxC [Pseudomonadota bacterium]MDA1320328.1 ribosome biogenesis GTP-binding protein YihA/YsxC [Pseudomonadota bacterium]NBR40431.1 YihA family ribosome biogenesis GTP-binding protein [Alphaproteobacteria bacterium]